MNGYPFSFRPCPVRPVETAHRRIVTPALPTPESVPLLETLQRHEPQSMAIDQLPVVWDRAEGYQVHDPYGNCWIDFTSGIFVANVGHGHPHVASAVRALVDRPLLHNYYFPSSIRARFVEKLTAMSPKHLDAVFLLTTGSETTECAIKLTRIHGAAIRPGKRGIVSLSFGFHGKTMGAQQASGRSAGKKWIGQLDPGFHQLPVPLPPYCPCSGERGHECGAACFEHGMETLERGGVDLGTIAGFMFEPYQGWSAALLPQTYVQAARAWADRHDALLIFDEVQSGFGRTGRLFAHEYFDVEADLVCCGKGIASGFPLSALLGRRSLVDVDPSLNSTHGGNPLGCAAALATLEVLEREGLVARAAALEQEVSRELDAIAARHPKSIRAVHGRGLVWGVHLVDPSTGELDVAAADAVTEEAMRRGVLLVRTGVGTLKIGPPLSIPAEALVEGLRVIGDAVDDVLCRRARASRE